MAIKVSGIYSHDETVNRHAKRGWQCPECYGIQVNVIEDRYSGQRSMDRFSCQECGNQWGRN